MSEIPFTTTKVRIRKARASRNLKACDACEAPAHIDYTKIGGYFASCTGCGKRLADPKADTAKDTVAGHVAAIDRTAIAWNALKRKSTKK